MHLTSPTSRKGSGLACHSSQHHLDIKHLSIVGWNDWLYQWIGYANWQYSRTFDVASDQIEGKTVWLKCDGLDTVANVR